MAPTASKPRRKIHIDLPAGLHQKLRIKAALDGVSIQSLVSRLIAAEVENIKVPATPRKASKER